LIRTKKPQCNAGGTIGEQVRPQTCPFQVGPVFALL